MNNLLPRTLLKVAVFKFLHNQQVCRHKNEFESIINKLIITQEFQEEDRIPRKAVVKLQMQQV
jgi:hypothetical protein